MMRKSTLIISIGLFISSISFAQFGDAEHEKDNLLYVAKTWGWLKYHHPNLKEDCDIDWDIALIETFRALNGAPQSEYHNILSGLILKAGPFKIGNGIPPDILFDEELNNIDIEWMASEHLSNSIKDTLQAFNARSIQSTHCGLTAFPAGNLDFSSEVPYYHLGLGPSKYYRILAMFRYWNIIDLFFPYKHLMDQDWDTTFKQFILPISNATATLDYHLNFKEFTTYINDSHSFVNSWPLTEWNGQNMPPFEIGLVENKTIIKRVFSPNLQVQPGDIVVSMDGIPISDYRNEMRKYAEGSNEVTIERNIDNLIHWGESGPFQLSVRKPNGNLVSYNNIVRNFDSYVNFHNGITNDPSFKTIEVNGCDFGYVDMGLLMQSEIEALTTELWSQDAIIFDCRNYPNGTLWPLIPHLTNDPIFIASFTDPSLTYAGHFFWADHYIGTNNSTPNYEGKIIVLQNEETQSQAEFTIMGLQQYNNTLVVGSQTAGADGNVSSVLLPGNIQIYFTGLGTYYGDKTPTQRIGIVPDVVVKPTIEGIRNGEDEVLDYALNCALIDGTSTSEESLDGQLTINPNPFSDFINVKNPSNENIHLQIIDYQGRQIASYNIQGERKISIPQLSAGFYVAAWKEEGRKYYKKLVRR